MISHVTRRFTAFLVAAMAMPSFVPTVSAGELNKLRCEYRADAVNARVFNVLKYGAVGDDKTDNSEAFSSCLTAVIEAGGGRMYLPAGVYRGRILIPAVSKPIPSWITVEIVGEGEPTPIFGTIGAFPLQNNGTIVKSLSKSGPAVISASSSPKSLYGGFSAVNVVIKNLDVRTDDDPGIGGIDLHYALQCKIENVFVNTGVYNVQASKPTHGTSGLITPACNNAALTILRNVVVTGYHTGILVNEHTDGDNINLASNINGLEFVSAYHASRFGRVGAQRCTHAISVTGKHGFSIEQLDMEIAGKGQTDIRNEWQATAFNIYDPDNLGLADVNYWVVEGNVGAVEKFTRKGGSSIRARRIGSVSSGKERAGE
ncbi:MAG: glycosyl hydrolase family 28-related protein [Planctomycetota bacterium]